MTQVPKILKAIGELKEEIEKLKTCKSTQNDSLSKSNQIRVQMQGDTTIMNFEELLTEINERNKRTKNLIIFGVNEQNTNGESTTQKESDRNTITEILQEVQPDQQFEITNNMRLGRYQINKVRPIKVCLKNEEQVHKIIKSAKLLKNKPNFGHIAISFDRTKRQIEQYKTIKDELIRRHNLGDTNCRIKYINGNPKIISTVNQNSNL